MSVNVFGKYEYVYAVYTEKSFTRAAKKLFISQPSLSAAIKNIENQVGAPLFERNGGKVTLTQIGTEYISAAEKIMRAESDFFNRIHDIYNLEAGKLTVGGSNYLSSSALPRIINTFSSRYPNIEVSLVEANSTTLGNMVQNEEIDIVIDSFDETMDIYEGYPLHNERILLCVPREWEINKKLMKYQISPENVYRGQVDMENIPSVNLSAFAQESFVILKKGNDMHNRAMSIFENEGISPHVAFSVDQLNISYALAESGMGACFVTDTLFKLGRGSENVVLYNVEQKYGSRTLYIAFKKNRYCTNAMKKFIDTAKEVLIKNVL